MVSCPFQPVPLLAEPQTSAHLASRRMRHLPSPLTTLDPANTYSRPSLRAALSSCVACILMPFRRGPLHRARHAWRPCCLGLCFVALLVNASPLARERMWHGPAASPRPFALTPCGMPVSASVPYKDNSSPLGIRRVALAWLPVASFPLVSGCLLATAVRSVPLGLSQASPSQLTCRQFISICFRPVRLHWLPAG